jgi:hypothetical protein
MPLEGMRWENWTVITAGQLIDRFRRFSAEQQQEVPDFVEFLATRRASMTPRDSSFGLWAQQCADITEEEMESIRKEMWRDFPREDV